jgi:hypothetical protein
MIWEVMVDRGQKDYEGKTGPGRSGARSAREPINSDIPGVVWAGDLLVEQGLAQAGAGGTDPGDPVDGVDGQTEAVDLVADSEFPPRIDVSFLLAPVDSSLPACRLPRAWGCKGRFTFSR